MTVDFKINENLACDLLWINFIKIIYVEVYIKWKYISVILNYQKAHVFYIYYIFLIQDSPKQSGDK